METSYSPPRSVLSQLADAAHDSADAPFLLMDGETYSYAEVHGDVEAFARGLHSAGVVAGDRVLVLLPNVVEAMWAWLGAQRIGAIDVPVSVEATGSSLAHVLSEVEPRAVVTTPELLVRLAETGAGTGIEVAVVVGDADGQPSAGWDGRRMSVETLMGSGGEAELPTVPALGDVATIMFSSGTTGPPKGVMLAHGYYPQTVGAYDGIIVLPPSPTIYCTQPLCHIDPRIVFLDALARRGRVILMRKFSASEYWRDVEAFDADAFIFIGAMLHLIFKQPTAVSDRGRRRFGMGSAIPADIHAAFSERFNVELSEGYGMTELYSMTVQRHGECTPGNVGRETPNVELRVVDENDEPVPDGTTGELVARPRRPYAHMLGYWGRPEATVEAWRGLWFHTGDLMRRLPDGPFQYVGRLKDSIRRRGENVSAWEVERAATKHDEVLEAAAIGLPAEVGDEDVALFVVSTPSHSVDPAALRAAMAEDLPRYALPRFIDVVASLPKTPSERVAKAVLKQIGLSPMAQDLEPIRTVR